MTDWAAEIDKVAFDAGTFTDGFLDMASYSPRNAKITRAVTVENVLTLLKRAEARGLERAANHCDECSGKLTVHQVAHELWAKADADE